MILRILQNLFRFLILVFIQVFILNQIVLPGDLNAYINPNIYVLFLLMLPIQINRLLLLFICFLCGLSIDIFMSTAGLHASACLFIGLVRPGLINLVISRESNDNNIELSMSGMGIQSFLIYASVLIVVHHFALMLLEAFNFLHFLNLLLRVVTASLSTIILITLSQLLIIRNR
ncbi:MAG: rod shape-determining protein MreD [Bacteroidetes bacterium]|nr:rod shape-determining protein MreD [Bacteroidota bacterium]